MVGFKAVICRPGRLIGEPFTNFDLAKLLKIDQGAKKGLIVDTSDVLDGDVQRLDVAESIARLANGPLPNRETIYSIVNKEGPAPTEAEWARLLSLFTVRRDMLTNRRET